MVLHEGERMGDRKFQGSTIKKIFKKMLRVEKSATKECKKRATMTWQNAGKNVPGWENCSTLSNGYAAHSYRKFPKYNHSKRTELLLHHG